MLQAAAPAAWGVLRAGWWLRFTDEGGPGWAQPDFFFHGPERIILLEAKLTETPAAWEQLHFLYRPLLQRVFPGVPVVSAQVCNTLARGREETIPVVTDLSAVHDGCVLHYLGW